MIQCSECEYFRAGAAGTARFACDPLSNIKEPECLIKWQLVRQSEQVERLERLVFAYEAQLTVYRRLAPLQEKMIRHMEREIDDAEDADRWKYDLDAGDDPDDENDRRERP